jgi:fatty-acyl-CoA synthase
MIRPDVMQASSTPSPRPASRPASCPSYGLAEATLAVSIMPPGEGIVVELVEETELSGGGKVHRDRPQRYRASSIAASRRATWRSRSATRTARAPRPRQIGKVWCRGPS